MRDKATKSLRRMERKRAKGYEDLFFFSQIFTNGNAMKPMWLAQAGGGGWMQLWLAVAVFSLSNLFAALAGGSLAHALGRPAKPAEP